MATMTIKFSPLYSIFKYIHIKAFGRLRFIIANIGEEGLVMGIAPHTVFREIKVLTKDKRPKEGGAVFEVIFHASKVSVNTIIKGTNSTFPIFVGLPGFCNKKFMVNKEANTFSGRYEWETVELAEKYSKSYAAKLMSFVSKPYPILFTITDKRTGEVVISEKA